MRCAAVATIGAALLAAGLLWAALQRGAEEASLRAPPAFEQHAQSFGFAVGGIQTLRNLA
jgi:hypothetical protein